MEPTKIDEKEIIKIQELIAPLIGKPAWRAFSGVAGWFSIQFDELWIENGKIQSNWSIFISGVFWEIYYEGKFHVSSEDTRVKILDLIRILEGKTLTDIEFNISEFRTIVFFDCEISMEISNSVGSSLDDDDWSIFMPGGKYIVFSPGNYWRLEKRKWD